MLIHTPQADGQPLASHFKVLIMGNASIHKDEDYLFHLGTHIKVRFIPPYCYHLSPLDNGAFGLVADFLKQNAADYATQPISVGLDKAFRVYRTGSEAGALAGRSASTTVSIGFIHCEWFCDLVIEYCLYKHRSSQKHNLTLSPWVCSPSRRTFGGKPPNFPQENERGAPHIGDDWAQARLVWLRRALPRPSCALSQRKGSHRSYQRGRAHERDAPRAPEGGPPCARKPAAHPTTHNLFAVKWRLRDRPARPSAYMRGREAFRDAKSTHRPGPVPLLRARSVRAEASFNESTKLFCER